MLDKIYQNVADRVPAKWKDKWNAWRYMAMLFNPRTHIRNIVGNVGFQPLRWTKGPGGGKPSRRGSPRSAAEGWDAPVVRGQSRSIGRGPIGQTCGTLSGNKYDGIRTEINSRRRIFPHRPLWRQAAKINSWALEAEDAIFKRITYADALAGYLQSNGVTAEQMRNNTVDHAASQPGAGLRGAGGTEGHLSGSEQGVGQGGADRPPWGRR